VDVLIVDDIQFLTGKEKTQDHFFHTFNDLYQSKKQLIFASDRSPKELTDIDARLISRFQWGLIADIHQPDFETRLAIIKRKSEDEGIDIPLNVLEFIAGNVKSSVREFRRCINRVITKITFDKRELSIELAKEVIFGIQILKIMH
jgi:chromosomal replication initiator protein